MPFLADRRVVVVGDAQTLRAQPRRDLFEVMESVPDGNTLVVLDLLSPRSQRPQPLGAQAGRAALRIDTTANEETRARYVDEVLAALGASAEPRVRSELARSEADLASIVSLSPTVESMERAYDPVKYGERSATPHVEISLPSARWPSLAPEGKHVLVARVQYVPERMTDTTSLADDVTKMVNAALPGFSGMVRHMRVTSPSELASDYGLDGGALTGGEISLDQILFMRPVPGWGRYRMPVDGLFLGGTGCHPGPGIFGGAGWLAARAVLS